MRTSYFVLGSYGDEERLQLEAVRDQVVATAPASNDDSDVTAFLMDYIQRVTHGTTVIFSLE